MLGISDEAVARVFQSYPPAVREKLLFLRALILRTASSIEEVGELEETLKWNEPSYLTPVSKSGSTIRIDKKKRDDAKVALYFKCTANLVPAMRDKFPTRFHFEENRAILFNLGDEIPVEETRRCIALALTYHLNKKLEPGERWAMVDRLLKA